MGPDYSVKLVDYGTHKYCIIAELQVSLQSCTGVQAPPVLKWLTPISLHTVIFFQCALKAATSQSPPLSWLEDMQHHPALSSA